MASPVWFGDESRPLFGMLHEPAGPTVFGGVVLCPSLGKEHSHSQYAQRLLAEHLAERGHVVLRFDYDGTGDSSGEAHDPGRVEAWLGSVAAAVELVRGSGVATVSLVGMRVGALFAAMAALRDGSIDRLVLWDPVAKGRTYLAEQRVLGSPFAARSTSDDAGSVVAPGMVFDGVTVEDLRGLDLTKTSGALAARVLVGYRPERGRGALAARLDLPGVDWMEVPGQADLLDVGSPFQRLPMDDIAHIAQWMAAAAGRTCASTDLRLPLSRSNAVVGRRPDGTFVHERPTRLGPTGLFGIVSEGTHRRDGPTVLFLNVANEHHIGPTRLWVDLARQLAFEGITSCRLDLSGLGESPLRRVGQPCFVTRAPEAFDDVLEACRALSPEDPSDVVLVGLCSSAYQALESALECLPRGVVAINPLFTFAPPEVDAHGVLDPRRRVAIPRRAAVNRLHGTGDTPITRLRRKVPGLSARIRDLAELAEGLSAPRRRRPLAWLRTLATGGVDVVFICGERESRPLLASALFARRKITKLGRVHLVPVPSLDHGLLAAQDRLIVAHEVVGYLTSHPSWEPASTVAGAEEPQEEPQEQVAC